MESGGPCYRCGAYGHIVADCEELKPAKTMSDHLKRIYDYGDRYAEKRWTLLQKRAAIKAENELWKAKQAQMTARRN
jgi:hypothetical protein